MTGPLLDTLQSTWDCITSSITFTPQRPMQGSCLWTTGAPQRCVLSPLLFSFYTTGCTPRDPSAKLLKLADDTTVISLVHESYDSGYRCEVEQMVHWCGQKPLELNLLKTVWTWEDGSLQSIINIQNRTVSTADTFKFKIPGSEVDLPHWLQPEKGPAEVAFPEIVQEVQPASGFINQTQHCHRPVCFLHFHHCHCLDLPPSGSYHITGSEIRPATTLQISHILYTNSLN